MKEASESVRLLKVVRDEVAKGKDANLAELCRMEVEKEVSRSDELRQGYMRASQKFLAIAHHHAALLRSGQTIDGEGDAIKAENPKNEWRLVIAFTTLSRVAIELHDREAGVRWYQRSEKARKETAAMLRERAQVRPFEEGFEKLTMSVLGLTDEMQQNGKVFRDLLIQLTERVQKLESNAA